MLKKSVLKNKNHIDSVSLTYEIIISIAKDKLTPQAEQLLIKMSYNLIKKFTYFNTDDRYDCRMFGLIAMLEKWRGFNSEKYDSAFPYLTEICKRGIVTGLHKINNTNNNFNVVMVSLDELVKF